MTSPPCQSFSLAGKRKGKDSDNGILFFNSHEFIQENKPRYFIFENVKGLLSDDNGKTFSEWCNMLGGKSINGMPVLFPYDNSVHYHIYHKVLNSKNYGVPQNRERVFIIGIRDDADNNFTWPKEIPLEKRLKDVLEEDVDPKYFLNNKQVTAITNSKHEHSSRVFETDGTSPTIMAKSGGGHEPYIKTELKIVGILTNEKYNDFSRRIYSSETIGRTLMGSGGNCNDKSGLYLIDTQCNQGVIQLNQSKESGGQQPYQQNRVYDINGVNPSINAMQCAWGGNIINTNKIRRLTPRECFRLQDFPDSFTWPVSDSQAYKQAGNSITVAVLYNIVKKLRTDNS